VRALVLLVHVLTALGAALGFLALMAAVRGDWPMMLFWLGVALVVDAVDGPLARGLKAERRLPRWDGRALDLVVDFTTYVFVPAYAIAASGVLPAEWGVLAGAVIVVTSALYFADTRMKTHDNRFRGFPGLWNVVIFYLLLLRPDPQVALAAVAVLVILTFLPVRFVHPLRVRRLRLLTLLLLGVWIALAAVAVFDSLKPEPMVVTWLNVIGVYFLLIGLLPGRRAQS